MYAVVRCLGARQLLQTSLPKFGGENFHLWKFKMSMVLKERKLWNMVKGTGRRPSESDAVNRLQYDKRDQRAQALVVLSLQNSELMHVRTATTAKET